MGVQLEVPQTALYVIQEEVIALSCQMSAIFPVKLDLILCKIRVSNHMPPIPPH